MELKKKGLTILEMMIATALFAIVMASVFPLVDQMMGRIQMARDHYVAATIAQARIERARGAPYADLSLMAENGALVDDFGNPSASDGRFRRTTVVTPNFPVEGMTRMTVQTQICICSRWGWRRVQHPLRTGKWICRFTTELEEMNFLFTEYKD